MFQFIKINHFKYFNINIVFDLISKLSRRVNKIVEIVDFNAKIIGNNIHRKYLALSIMLAEWNCVSCLLPTINCTVPICSVWSPYGPIQSPRRTVQDIWAVLSTKLSYMVLYRPTQWGNSPALPGP